MSSAPATLAEIRTAIDDADEIILRALGARMKAVKFLKALKQQAGMKIVDLKREEVVRATWKKRAEELGIAPELALIILDFLLSESKRVQGFSVVSPQ